MTKQEYDQINEQRERERYKKSVIAEEAKFSLDRVIACANSIREKRGNLILIQLLANRLFQRGKNPLSLCRFFGILDIFAEIHAKNAHIRTLRQCSRRDIYVYSRSVCHLYIFIMNGGRHFFCCDISLGLLCRDILPHGFALPVLRLYSNLCLRLRSLCLLFSLFLLDF